MRIYDMVKAGQIPPVIDHDKIHTIVTHACNFHADEVALVALIKECHNPDVKVIRTNDISEYTPGNGVLIADIGDEYDGEWFYDHHQINWNENNPDEFRSAVGLFWDDWGNPIYYRLIPFFREIDKHDTLRSKEYKSQLCFSIGDMNPPWDDRTPENFEKNFYAAVEIISVLLRARISSNLGDYRAYNYISSNIKIKDGIMYLDRYVPWRDYTTKNKDVYAVISKGRHGGFNCHAVTGLFPRKWVDERLPFGISWVHRSRFICECDTIEHAEWAALNIINKY